MRRVRALLVVILLVAGLTTAAVAAPGAAVHGRTTDTPQVTGTRAGAHASSDKGRAHRTAKTKTKTTAKAKTKAKARAKTKTKAKAKASAPKKKARKPVKKRHAPAKKVHTLAATAAAAAVPSSGFVSEQGDQLMLAGKPYRFTGVNMYEGMSDFPVNRTCGPTINDVDAAFSKLPAGSMVRVWAYQAQAINAATGQIDWAPFDRFIDAATRHGIKLDMVLGDQAGVCDDDHFKDQAWYRGGYTQAYNDWPAGDYRNGEDPESWWTWIHQVVPRYANNPTIAFWEPLNEPQTSNCNPGHVGQDCYGNGSCPDGNAELLRDWFTTVGAEIHKMAPNQLVASGTIGNGECGDWEQYYGMMASSPGVDVLTVHDYTATGIPANMEEHIGQAAAANKPIVWEEVGTTASPDGSGCWQNTTTRATDFAQKISQLAPQQPVAGFLAWNWIEHQSNGCAMEIDNTDPLMTVLAHGLTS